MSEILDLFRKFAEVDYAVVVPTPIYCDVVVPARKHRRRRIQKKWLKRYGTRIINKLDYIYDRPIASPADLSPKDDYERQILLRMTIRTKPSSLVRLPVLPKYEDTFLDPTTASVEVETVTYEFPKIAMVHRLSYEFYIEFFENIDLQRQIFASFYDRAALMVENGTKVNGVSGYGELDSEIVFE